MFSSNPKELIKIFKMNRYYLILLYGLLGACLFSVSLQAAAPVLELEAGQKNYNLNSTLEVLEDPSRELSFQQIQTEPLAERFVPISESGNSFGYSESAFWVRLRVKNSSTVPGEWRLEYQNAAVEQLQFFDGSGSQSPQYSGSLTPLNQRNIPYHHPSFVLDLQAGEERTLHLRIESRTDIDVRLSLRTLFEHQKDTALDQTFEGIFYGTMIAMVLYNLILFAVIRYRIYLFYVLYQLGTFIHWSFIDGTSNQMIQDGITNPIGWRIFWAGFLAAAAILFAQTLLETRERNPFSHRILNIIFLLHLPFLIAPFFTGFLLTWSIQAVYLMSAVLYIPLLTVLISGAVKGFRPARLTLLCWGAFGVGAALSFLTQIGWLPSTAFTRNSMPIGVMIEAVLFSLILSGRFLEIRAEKESAQQEAIQNLTRADELKDRLLASTSHELRTPLHGIIGLAETIRDEKRLHLANCIKHYFEVLPHSLRYKAERGIKDSLICKAEAFPFGKFGFFIFVVSGNV